MTRTFPAAALFAAMLPALAPALALAQPADRARRPALPAAAAPAANALPMMDRAAFAADLDAALEIDAQARGIAAQRRAAASRDALVQSPTPGAPALGGSWRSDARGPRTAQEWDVELAAPVWLPGQRGALAGTVAAAVEEQDRRLALRRLDLAGLLRDAYWTVGAAQSDLRVAQDRLATARDLGRDVARRVAFGDIAATEALLTRNEELAAELDLARAEAAVASSRAAYRLLTGGSERALLPAGAAPPPAGARPEPMPGDGAGHPAIRAAEAALAAATARAALVAATPIDNPELGVFVRGQAGPVTEEGTSLGLRMRLPLPSAARNVPRQADAEAERSRAEAELAQARRLVTGEIALARAALAAADQARRVAGERLAVTGRQIEAARSSFRNGEIGAFDLYRVRQLQIEAVAAEARAQVDFGRARSRLNQALGLVPGG